MSREVKRVADGFDWPMHEVWCGFLMPERLQSLPCPAGEACENGSTAARAWVEAIARLLLQLDSDLQAQEQHRPIHPYLNDIGYYGNARPSADIAEFGTGLAGREAGWIGHDSIDAWRATAKLIKAAGLKKKWGRCPTCKGRAYVDAYEGQEADAEAWVPIDPPVGEWWQVWETVSEGSPVSPAFATPEELAAYVVDNESTRGPRGFVAPITQAQALAWITGPGWAPSGIITSEGMKSGIDSMIPEASA